MWLLRPESVQTLDVPVLQVMPAVGPLAAESTHTRQEGSVQTGISARRDPFAMATRCSARAAPAARLLGRKNQSRRRRLLRQLVAPAQSSCSARDCSSSARSFASVLRRSASLSRAWTCSRSSSSRSSPVAPAAAALRARISARTLSISRFTSASSREPSSVLVLASGKTFCVRTEAVRQPQRLRARVRAYRFRPRHLAQRPSLEVWRRQSSPSEQTWLLAPSPCLRTALERDAARHAHTKHLAPRAKAPRRAPVVRLRPRQR